MSWRNNIRENAHERREPRSHGRRFCHSHCRRPALAAKKCDIVGTFKDSLGSTGKFTSEKKGTVSNTAICAQPYSLTVTKLTDVVIDVKGKSKDKSCGALTGDFTFQDGGCTSAAGTVTIKGLGSFNDTITHTGKAMSHPPQADTSMLTAGFK